MARLGRRQPFKPLVSRVPAAAGGATYTLTCAAGSYAIAGQAATLAATHNYALACAAGAYTYTGKAATLTYTPGATTVDYTLTCVAGAYAISGQAANLTYARSMVAAAGAYAISGQAATLTVARNLALAPGAYSISGKDAVLTYTGATAYALDCEAGSYTISGQDAALSWSGAATAIGGWALRSELAKRKKKDDDEKERLLAEVIEVPIPTKPDTRRKLTLEQIIGPQAAAQMSLPDLTHEIETIKRKKRQRMEEEMLLMY